MKKIPVLLILVLQFTFQIRGANSEPCDCVENARAVVNSPDKNQGVIAYANTYITTLKMQLGVLQQAYKSSGTRPELKAKIKGVLPIIPGAIKKLEVIKSSATKAALSEKEFKALTARIRAEAYKPMIDADNIIVIIIGGPIKGGGGGGDDGGVKPDCSGAGDATMRDCQEGINIKAECGFYNDNGGASAMDADLAGCESAKNAAIASCERNPDTHISSGHFYTNAQMVCSQVARDRDIQEPAQTQTSTGN